MTRPAAEWKTQSEFVFGEKKARRVYIADVLNSLWANLLESEYQIRIKIVLCWHVCIYVYAG